MQKSQMNPEEVMEGFCPVCMHPMSGVVYARRVVKMKGAAVGDSPHPVEEAVTSYVRTDVFECGLERDQCFVHQKWLSPKYDPGKKCSNSQSVALALREKEQKAQEMAKALAKGGVDAGP